jgi:hypothetical protein
MINTDCVKVREKKIQECDQVSDEVRNQVFNQVDHKVWVKVWWDVGSYLSDRIFK